MIDRMIVIRKKAGLNQEQFAKRLGLSRSFVNQVETGKKNISDRTISDICREFHVNETWFRTGEGEMSIPSPSSVVDVLAIEYHLSQQDRALIEKFLGMRPEMRQAVMEFMLEVTAALNSDNTPLDLVATRKSMDARHQQRQDVAHTPPASGTELTVEQEVEQEVERYRQQLLTEKKKALQASSAKESGSA